MQARIISLPRIEKGAARSGERTEWRLDTRGLEWTDAAGQDRWMPFACVRLATLGNLGKRGWCLRLSGPPGAVILGTGHIDGPSGAIPAGDVARFRELAVTMIEGAAAAGCRARFRINHSGFGLGWKFSEPLWARRGWPISDHHVFIKALPD